MKSIRSIFRNLWRKKQVEADLDAEVRAFVDLQTDENLRLGMSPAHARRQAFVLTGGIEQVKESVREVRAGSLIEQLFQDVRFGLRMLRKDPAFAVVAILTIALGIGVNAGTFSILNSITLQPLSVTRPGRLVSIYQVFQGHTNRFVHGNESFFSYPEYLEYRDRNQVFSGVMAYTPLVRAWVSGVNHEAFGQLVSCNYFDVLKTGMQLGRGLLASECAAGGTAPSLVVSDRFWRNELSSDPGVIGKVIRLNRQPFTVVGVAAPDFTGTDLIAASYWLPLTMQQALEGTPAPRIADDNMSWLVVIGRLKDNVSLADARAQLSLIAASIDRRHPGRTTRLSIDTATLLGAPEERRIAIAIGSLLFAAVALVLLIVCANVANLMLARSAGRRTEFAVRLALGAAKGRVVRQLLTESLLIALIGGALGLMIAVWSSRAALVMVAQNLPADAPQFGVHIKPDLRVFLYTFALALMTGMIFGLAPALQATKRNFTGELRREAIELDSQGRPKTRLRTTLVAAQIAFSTVLLVVAGLLVRGLSHAHTHDPGFDMRNVAVATFNLAGQGYTPDAAVSFHRQLKERLRNIPGVEAVAETGTLQIDGGRWSEPFTPSGQPERNINFNAVSPEYFRALRIPLVRGREFTAREEESGAHVAVVTESTARLLWPGEEPIGEHLTVERKTDVEIVGIARDTDTVHLGRSDEPYVYLLYGKDDELRLQVLVRQGGEFKSSAEAIRSAVREIDPDLGVRVAPLKDGMEVWYAPSRMGITFTAALAALALIISSIGIYGTVAYSVGRRTREIGIRIALGAGHHGVVRMLLRQAMRPVMIGALIGFAASIAASQAITTLLYGMSRFDPLAYVLVVAFLSGVALFASYLPARRALRVDPMTAIRHE